MKNFWHIIKKLAIDFGLTFFSVFDWRNDGFSCAENDEKNGFCRWLLPCAVLFGAFLRIWVFYSEPVLGRDAVYYLDMAEMWSNSSFAAIIECDPSFYIPPVMLGFIQFFIRLGASPLIAGVVLNLLAGIALIPLFYLIAKHLFNSRKAGITAAFLVSFNPVLVEYSANVMRENFMALFMAAALLGIISGFRRKSYWFAAGGFFTAFSILSRYEAMEILPLLAFTLAVFGVLKIFTWKKIFSGGLWFAGGLLLGFITVTLIFGIPMTFYQGAFPSKIDRTLL